MVLLALADAIRAGVRGYNFMNNFAKQKERWHATITDTWAVQVFRTWSLPWLKARLGEARRRMAAPAPSQRHATSNLSKPSARDETAAPSRKPRGEERDRCRRLLGLLESEGARLQRRRGAELATALPIGASGERS
jgi:hypothetical protein